MRLAVHRLDPAATLPTRAHRDDAGFDLYAVEDITLAPGERAAVRTGIAVEVPERHAGLVLPRSGLAAQHGIALVNAPGLIDAGYRGELRVLLLNTDRSESFSVRVGDRIAQLVVTRVEAPDIIEVQELAVSDRGKRGFGSTGS
jgi:dUTP diphosphatase